ncbi:MAG: hypothetical protein JRC93_11650 [Deltaproteobacteria bacterium]|nr:hypothetical protein [Deltaproteobacteria bacterium]MBW2632237.1 hypothetical protein [Deltaproteobacteria bacterium]
MSPTAVKEEVFDLNQNVTGVTARDLAAKTADASLQPVFEYLVPVGYSLVFSREDTLAAYLEDNEGSPAECVAGVRVDVVVMDSSKMNVRSILNPIRYGGIKDFTNEDKLAHLDVPDGEVIVAKEGERVCLRADSSGAIVTIDASDCYFRLTCRRIRHSLFE